MRLTEKMIAQEVKDICQYMMDYCITDSGIVSYYVDIDTDKCSSKIIGGDIGDFTPFVYWAGQYLEDDNIKNWACHQMDLYIDLLQRPSGIYVSSPDSSFLRLDIVDYRDLSDLIVGLDLMYTLTGNKKYLYSMEKFYAYLKNDSLIVEKSLFYFRYYPAFKIGLPVSFGQAAGIFIEEAVQLAIHKNNESYLSFAEKLLQPWVTCQEFDGNGLFPFLVSKKGYRWLIDLLLRLRTGLNLNQAVLFKQNTNLCFGIINLLKRTKSDEIKKVITKWCDSVIDLLQDARGFFYAVYDFKKRKRKNIILNYNNAVMDVFLDLQIECNIDCYVEAAKKCADSWLEKRTMNGLITQGLEGQYKSYEGGMTIPYYWLQLDSQVDFALVLMKLYELTNNHMYRDSVNKILSGIFQTFKYRRIYADMVDPRSGKACRKLIEVKFLSLFLKFLLAYLETAGGKKLLENEKLRNLIRDR